MSKMWQKENTLKLHPMIERYEVGTDYLYDGKLFRYELASSHAHSIMLKSIGILTEAELSSINTEIKRLYQQFGDSIDFTVDDEDVHSKLENLLIQAIGDTGKKVHTGRSRNDQVMVVMRLYEREKLLETALEYCDFLDVVQRFIEREGRKILPGYTHTKQAMLMDVGMWAGAFLESGFDNLKIMRAVLDLLDSNPLGSGSGFGVPIALNRDMTASLLGFSRVQLNPMAVQNSRGKYESALIDSFWNIMNDFSRMAADMLTYNMDELLFLKTNAAITTGSSIMPQKRNLDVMELVRARANQMLSYSTIVKTVSSGVLSGYNRDIQETKEPVFKAFELISASINAVAVVFENIEFDEDAIKKSLSKGIFATDIAFEQVGNGVPFRDAYKYAAQQMEKIVINNELIEESLSKRVSPGSPRTLDYKTAAAQLQKEKQTLLALKTDLTGKLDALLK